MSSTRHFAGGFIVSLAVIRRPPSRFVVFFGVAAAMFALALFALRPLFEAKPSPVQLKVGQKRALPLSVKEPYADVDLPGVGVIGLERDARRRLLLVAKAVGKARLRVYADAKLLHTFDVEVVPAPLRKIEVKPFQTKKKPPEPIAKKPEPPKPEKPKMREVKPVEEKVAALPEPEPERERQRDKEPEIQRNIILPKREKKPETKPERALDKKKVADTKLLPKLEKKGDEKLPEQKKEKEKQPPPGKKMVELDTANKKKPKEAKYLAQEDSAVEKETRAKTTTLIKTKPGEQQPDEARNKPNPGGEKAKVADDRETAPNPGKERKLGREKREAIAAIPERKVEKPAAVPEAPRRAPTTDPRSPGEIADRGRDVIKDDYPTGPPRKIRLYPSAATISQVLKEFPAPRKGRTAQEEEEGDEGTAGPHKGKSKIATRMPGGKWRKIWQRVQGFLENFIPEVNPGSHTALNAQRSTYAAYIARAHRKIHVEWGFGLWNQFRDLPDPGGFNPVQSSIITRLEIKLDAKGRVTRIGIVRTSGSTAFDGATMAAVLKAAPFGAPPADMISRDGSTYLHWNFYQDGRQCWTNDVQVFVNDS